MIQNTWTFIKHLTCFGFDLYREFWKSLTGKYPGPNDPLLKVTKTRKIARLEAPGVKRRLDKIVRKIGLRASLPAGKRRYEVQLSHGFRRYFNTMMRRAGVNYLDKEDIMSSPSSRSIVTQNRETLYGVIAYNCYGITMNYFVIFGGFLYGYSNLFLN